MLALVLTTAAQAGAAVQPEVTARCEEACNDGDESGHCPPACSCACVCHAPKQQVQPTSFQARAAVVVVRQAPSDDASPVCPDPEPMRHVPKAAA